MNDQAEPQNCLRTETIRPIMKSSLSHAQSRLVELFQTISFGTVEGLKIKGGQPLFSPPPRIVQKVKLGGDHPPRPESDLQDFSLKQPVIELFQAMESIGDGEVRSILIRHGLPQALELERVISAD